MTHYDTLGVEPGASREEIIAAYRRAAMATHPDLLGDASAERLAQAVRDMQVLNALYEVLTDAAKREEYDRTHGIVAASRGSSARDEYYALRDRVAATLERADRRRWRVTRPSVDGRRLEWIGRKVVAHRQAAQEAINRASRRPSPWDSGPGLLGLLAQLGNVLNVDAGGFLAGCVAHGSVLSLEDPCETLGYFALVDELADQVDQIGHEMAQLATALNAKDWGRVLSAEVAFAQLHCDDLLETFTTVGGSHVGMGRTMLSPGLLRPLWLGRDAIAQALIDACARQLGLSLYILRDGSVVCWDSRTSSWRLHHHLAGVVRGLKRGIRPLVAMIPTDEERVFAQAWRWELERQAGGPDYEAHLVAHLCTTNFVVIQPSQWDNELSRAQAYVRSHAS